MKIICVVAAFVLCGCSPGIHIAIKDSIKKPLGASTDVLIIDKDHSAPDSCILLGEVTTGANLFTTDCSYDSIMQYIKREAIKAGGNVVKITELAEPGVRSACYKIKANILFCPNFLHTRAKAYSIQDSIAVTKFPERENAKYALLYVYRTNNPQGYAREMRLRLKDSIICRLNNNSKYEIRLYKEGRTTLWTQGETKDSVSINVTFGTEYFLKCTLKMGILFGRPDMELISAGEARYEYEHIGE